MLSMLRPVNIEIQPEDQYFMKLNMDFSKSSFTNISVKQQPEEYSLKKETYCTTSSDDDVNIDDRSKKSDQSSDDEGNKKVEAKNTFVGKSSEEEDRKKPSLIKAGDIKSYDILCGRDKATFNNIGNRRFRVLISLNIPRYEKATTKAEKASVIKYICDIFRNEVGVRFLKKHKNGEGYFELSVSEARKKVGHALRDMSVARQEVKKRRDEMKRNVMREHVVYSKGSRRMSSMDFDPILEPLPLGEEDNCRTQNQQQQQPNIPAHWTMDHSSIPDILTQHLQQQQLQFQRPAMHEQFATVQEKLLDLQKKQQQLQQEREALLRQQQYQQELLEQQICNRRLRSQQEQVRQQQQNQLQNQEQQEGFNQFDHFFDAISRQQNRRR